MAPLVPGWPLLGRRSGALGAGSGWGSGTHESGRDGTRDPGCRWWGQEARGQWGWGSRAVDSSKGEGVSTYGDWPVSWVKSRRIIVVKEIQTAKSRLPHCAAEASQAPGCGPSSPGAAPPIQRSPCTFLQRRESLSREAGWARGPGLGLCVSGLTSHPRSRCRPSSWGSVRLLATGWTGCPAVLCPGSPCSSVHWEPVTRPVSRRPVGGTSPLPHRGSCGLCGPRPCSQQRPWWRLPG